MSGLYSNRHYLEEHEYMVEGRSSYYSPRSDKYLRPPDTIVMVTYPLEKLIIHCSATPVDMNIGVAEIREWHKRRGFRDIGYHKVIRRTGVIEEGRRIDNDGQIELEEIGAHTLGYNRTSIGYCLVGGINDDGDPEFNFTANQIQVLYWNVFDERMKHPQLTIHGHNEFADKACPCFNVRQWWYG